SGSALLKNLAKRYAEQARDEGRDVDKVSRSEALSRLKQSHGVQVDAPKPAIVLASIPPERRANSFTLKDLDGVFGEYVKKHLDGDWRRLSAGPAFSKARFSDPSGQQSVTGETLLRNLAKRYAEWGRREG